MNELDERLRQFAKSGPQSPGPQVEEHLLAEFRKRHLRRPMWVYIAQGAAIVIVSLAVYFGVSRHPKAQPAAAASFQTFDSESLPGFTPLPYAQSGVPLGEAVVMRVQLPPSEFEMLGASVPRGTKHERIGADVLIGQDGVPRAVRFLPKQ